MCFYSHLLKDKAEQTEIESLFYFQRCLQDFLQLQLWVSDQLS